MIEDPETQEQERMEIATKLVHAYNDNINQKNEMAMME